MTSKDTRPKYKAFNTRNFRTISQIAAMPEEKIVEMEVVAQVLPFKSNNYVVDELIDWSDPMDPIFLLTFPQKEMLSEDRYNRMAEAVKGGDKAIIAKVAYEIRMELNPHPAGQMEHNVPTLKDGTLLRGMQHKYDQTVLYFPSQSQTCHAYCSFCYRWAQFVGIDELKFAMKEGEHLVQYLSEHPEVSDVLFTGGDPMVMSSRVFKGYIDKILEADLPNLKTIRIGTKSLAYWPYKFTSDPDAEDMLAIIKKIIDHGIHVTFMSHFNHPAELRTQAVRDAAKALKRTGAQIRTQTPLLRHINDSVDWLAEMWQTQVNLGMVPYYLFMARDTGAQDYFAVPLVRAWNLYRDAVQETSGIGRTVRGPSMSAGPGKIHVLGVSSEYQGEKVMVLQFLQGRNSEWTNRPFLAKYDEDAVWIDDLKPAFGKSKFFFEDEYEEITSAKEAVIKPKLEGLANS